MKTATQTGNGLRASELTVAYQRTPVLDGLDVQIPDGAFTVIVGANGCGKSTLLRTLARVLVPSQGAVYLDDTPIRSLPPKQVARRLGLLPQGPTAPDGITVLDLVARGRHPHQGLLNRWSEQDERAVREAMAATDTIDLAGHAVDELSGGQRQRVWLAMTLAQETGILLLDEPTTFLDLAHQVEVLNLCARLPASGRTLVAVLHDLNLACRYADHLIAMRGGEIAALGPPRDIVTAELIEHVFGLSCRVIDDPETGTPLVIPLAPRLDRAPAILTETSAP